MLRRSLLTALTAMGMVVIAACSGGTPSTSPSQDSSKLTVWVDSVRLPVAQAYAKAHPDLHMDIVTYDGDGNRLSATTSGTPTNYAWDTNSSLPQLATETDSAGALLRRYTYGVGRISMTTPSTTAYYSTDAVGSVTELSGAAGAVLGQYSQQPFGDSPTSSSVDPSVAGNPFSFAGEYQDPTTSLYNLRARNYDSTTSRFLSPDPLGPQDAASTYTYVADNPLGYTDPSGRKRGGGCGSILCFVESPEFLPMLANGAVGVASGCLSGAEYGTALIDTPFGYGVALSFGPEATAFLPLASCIGGAIAGGVLAYGHYDGPDPSGGGIPPDWTPSHQGSW
jgi:RHS repeat-associated protein